MMIMMMMRLVLNPANSAPFNCVWCLPPKKLRWTLPTTSLARSTSTAPHGMSSLSSFSRDQQHNSACPSVAWAADPAAAGSVIWPMIMRTFTNFNSREHEMNPDCSYSWSLSFTVICRLLLVFCTFRPTAWIWKLLTAITVHHNAL